MIYACVECAPYLWRLMKSYGKRYLFVFIFCNKEKGRIFQKRDIFCQKKKTTTIPKYGYPFFSHHSFTVKLSSLQWKYLHKNTIYCLLLSCLHSIKNSQSQSIEIIWLSFKAFYNLRFMLRYELTKIFQFHLGRAIRFYT